MGYLGLGILTWTCVHWLKRLAPDFRHRMSERMGEASKGLIAVLLVMSIILMVFGYKRMEFIPVWEPAGFLKGINNLLMVLAFYVYGASARKSDKVWLGTKLRHPQLVGFIIWAVAHLLVNGDLASIILFGGLLVWAIGSIVLINRAEGAWIVPEQAPARSEGILVGITLVLFAIVSAIHIWLGVSPFGG